MIKHRPGAKFLTAAPEGETISCMVVHAGRIYFATRDTVYCYKLPGWRSFWDRVKLWCST